MVYTGGDGGVEIVSSQKIQVILLLTMNDFPVK